MADSQENKQKEQNDVSEKNFMIEKAVAPDFDHGFHGGDLRSGGLFHFLGFGTGDQ